MAGPQGSRRSLYRAKEWSIAGHRTHQALERLTASLTRLEAVAELHGDASALRSAAEEDRARLERDRAELALRLDAAEARAASLLRTNREVAGRLVGVMEAVRRLGSAPPDTVAGEEER